MDKTSIVHRSGEHRLAVDEEAAARLMDVSAATLRRWRRQRKGPQWFKLSRLVRYRVRDLELFLARQVSP